MIVKRGNKFLVMDSKGDKVLGTHDSEASAERQLTAIHISQHNNESRLIKFSDFLNEQLMTLEYHDQLNPDFWKGYDLKPEVREKLIEIGHEWAEWAKIPVQAIKDFVFVGGNANFNYTPKSDVDLHLLVDTNEIADCPEFIEDYFEDKKDIWALKHDIKIYGHPVEIYAQNVDYQFPEGQGVFSLSKNQWLAKPINKDLDLNNIPAAPKANELKDKIHNMITHNIDDQTMKSFKETLKDMRSNSIENEGEFGQGNLIFKELRNLGYLEKINQYIRSKQDQRLSL
jgi:hypothetical protein